MEHADFDAIGLGPATLAAFRATAARHGNYSDNKKCWKQKDSVLLGSLRYIRGKQGQTTFFSMSAIL
ncbi:MAG: hypothetical protein N838_16500 [Thiohalocapsa sp. PB-PSB1]|nr:MAG: hypothetical protein N838_16500 [Thiohalocapsa sp. PB-PSB1]